MSKHLAFQQWLLHPRGVASTRSQQDQRDHHYDGDHHQQPNRNRTNSLPSAHSLAPPSLYVADSLLLPVRDGLVTSCAGLKRVVHAWLVQPLFHRPTQGTCGPQQSIWPAECNLSTQRYGSVAGKAGSGPQKQDGDGVPRLRRGPEWTSSGLRRAWAMDGRREASHYYLLK
jgi:hypothetical protein